jgi:hypothetical protein
MCLSGCFQRQLAYKTPTEGENILWMWVPPNSLGVQMEQREEDVSQPGHMPFFLSKCVDSIATESPVDIRCSTETHTSYSPENVRRGCMLSRSCSEASSFLDWATGFVDDKTVFSEDLGSCIPVWKNPSRVCGCKWGLLKVKEREIQRQHGGAQVESAGRESMLSFFSCF